MTTSDTHVELDALRAGDVATAALKEALARVGMTLPSLTSGYPVGGRAFVELGGCSAGTAVQLAEIITAAADSVPQLRVDR